MAPNMKSGSPLHAAVMGLCGLAVAMGIGRFAFTPMLPLMQASGELTLQQGSYLASANYLGYLLGAAGCFFINPRPGSAARFGLVAVAVATIAMATEPWFPLWFAARLVAGVASAFVLVGVSAWALTALAAHGRAAWSGWVFAGVGIGIIVAGLVALGTGATDRAPSTGWLVLGIIALLVTILFAGPKPHSAVAVAPLESASRGLDLTAWRLVICYGAFGFGYIIPATFLPAAARALVDDPIVFGWTWPVFGLAAAASTVFGATALKDLPPRHSMALGHAVMAAGVALPVIDTTLLSLVISALCVGGTFMLITMTGMQEARRIGGDAAPRLMAAMTAAFATGQLLGPLLVGGSGSAAEAIRYPSLLAAGFLLITATALLPGARASKAIDSRNPN